MGLSPASSGKGGGTSGGASVLFDSTLGADAASIDSGAGGFSTGLTILDIYLWARTDEAVVFSTVNLTVNNDTGANYDLIRLQGNNATAAAANILAAANWHVDAAGASQVAGLFALSWIRIPAYASSFNPKHAILFQSEVGQAAANTLVTELALAYRAATAISRVKAAPGGGTVLKASSRLLIIGT